MAHKHYCPDDTLHDLDTNFHPNLKYTGRVFDDPDWFNIEHSHDFCEMLYVFKGQGTISVKGIRYQVHEGNLIIYNPHVTHQEWSDSDDRLHLLFCAFDSFKLPNLPDNHLIAKDARPVLEAGEYKSKLDQYFFDLISETSSGIIYSNAASESLLIMLILVVLRINMVQNPSMRELSESCQKVKSYIDENYMQNISLDTLSNFVYISKDHFSHLFKAEMGISPIRYLIHKRIEEACRLLMETDHPIREIGNMIGYDDSVYFSQLFKKATGLSPNQYRKEHAAN